MLSKERLFKLGRGVLLSISIVGSSTIIHEFGNSKKVAADSGPKVIIFYPPDGSTLENLRPFVNWIEFYKQKAFVTQMQFQLSPVNNDGPGVNMHSEWSTIYDDTSEDTLLRSSNFYGILAPLVNQQPGKESAENCVVLPGMKYFWQARASEELYWLDPETDNGWGPWGKRNHRTPTRNSDQIQPLEPNNPIKPTDTQPIPQVNTLTPRLRWMNSNLGLGKSDVFYYELQLSEDSNFEIDPKKAKLPVYEEIVNGCVTNPINSYQVREDHPLKSKSTYSWRLRPRIQGDGQPVAWSQTWQFKTP